MPTTTIIVDDFFDSAAQLREAALRMDYPDVQGKFPGRNSQQRLQLEGLDQEVSRLVGEPLVSMPPPQAHGKFRIATAGDVGSAKVHVDTAHWSGILYLSRPEDCRGGTEFFRHRATNSDRGPISDEEARAQGYASARQMISDILERDTMNDAAWELTMRVPMRFNRLVLLRPWLWHTAGEAFGDSLENGRLIYLMFFASARQLPSYNAGSAPA
ncbi:DUF6445 family protein [Arenimonas donghaensis]|uniref:Prolyl 4-hydroxylase alpha subunit Fe(2+) 2OG dioxygenase domain-containing protein n=1 Tax=Arenimonas donghaensis DSM 18148 = HO3-R19 TaxID=1121014 RepID=A0A087MLI7_9GAMM|nr:DUF6445 family protein [Arenimonas donghaensis]KFL37740.1 hypothetical protein N788_00800 [Arenimonas donghaensis DSM 18148 = HO3-R19]